MRRTFWMHLFRRPTCISRAGQLVKTTRLQRRVHSRRVGGTYARARPLTTMHRAWHIGLARILFLRAGVGRAGDDSASVRTLSQRRNVWPGNGLSWCAGWSSLREQREREREAVKWHVTPFLLCVGR